MNLPASYDLAPLAALLAVGVLVASLPLMLAWYRHRRLPGGAMLRAVTLATLFLTFDLIVFGAYTRLTDSGLGCPDWPGCYGHASPLGAHAAIGAAQQAMPTGPVTHGKAWVEMIHRYLATGVGALITLLMIWQWVRWVRGRRNGDIDGSAAPAWATATLLWVCVQGAFGALTVTMKLYPAIVTAHLLGGLGLLALLAAQAQAQTTPALSISRPLRAGIATVLGLTTLQVALGGWVSTNYAVLACGDFPTCQGEWWPPADFANGFTLLRQLGETVDGSYLPFAALTAIHLVHRLGAVALTFATATLVWRLAISDRDRDRPEARRWAVAVAAVMAWQLASGLGNVLLGWPLASAVAHTAGAAALVGVLVTMLARSRRTVALRGNRRGGHQVEGADRPLEAQVDRRPAFGIPTLEVSSAQGLPIGAVPSLVQGT